MKEHSVSKNEFPPDKLTEIVEQIRWFQSQRLAKELWDIGENLFRKEKLWAHFFNFNYCSYLVYSKPNNICSLNYGKKGFYEDTMSFIQISKTNNIDIILDRYPLLSNEEDTDFVFEGRSPRKIYSVLMIDKDNDRRIFKPFVDL
jgi:hypothetical protein